MNTPTNYSYAFIESLLLKVVEHEQLHIDGEQSGLGLDYGWANLTEEEAVFIRDLRAKRALKEDRVGW